MRATILLLLPFTGACASLGQVPSLAPRPIEKLDTAASAPAPPPPAVPADPALTARIAGLLADARKGDTAFVGVERGSVGAINAGHRAAEGSDAWIAGQTALSALEAARQQSADALATIDALLVAQVETSSGGIDALSAARDEASAIVAWQTERLAAFSR